MPRTLHEVQEDPTVLRACSRGDMCVWAGGGGAGNHPLPRTLEYFPKDSWMPDGMSVRCKKCASQDTMTSRRRKKFRERRVDAAPTEGSE